MKDLKSNKKTRKVDADIILKDGRLFYLEEEMTEERPLEEVFEPFVGDFVKLNITNEIKSDTFDEDTETEE